MDFQRLFQILPKMTDRWDTDDVYIWLTFLGLHGLFQKFRSKAIDGSCLLYLDEHDLIYELEIKQTLVVRKLLKWIKQGLLKYNEYIQQNEHESQQQEMSYSISQNYVIYSNRKSNDTNKRQVQTVSKNMDFETSIKPKKTDQELVIEQIVEDDTKFGASFCFQGKGGKVGRCANNQIVILDDNVSKVHCLIQYFQGSGYYLNDFSVKDQWEHSSNRTGTWIKITSRVIINEETYFQMGESHFVITPNAIKSELTIQFLRKEQNSLVDRKMLRTVVYKSAEKSEITFGRKSTNDVSFTYDNTLSSLHAKISFVKGKWLIEDRCSTNGTWRLLTKREQIENEMVFRIGQATNVFRCNLNSGKKTRSKRNIKDEDICLNCKKNQRNTFFRPCCHCAYCEGCSKMIEICPVCLGRIKEITRFFRG